MVNLNNCTKIMVNRCIELLSAKIAHAQTRHIAKRVPMSRVTSRKIDLDRLQQERQKTQKYEASKRLSMWEQNKEQSPSQDADRLDQSHYKHYGLNERKYDCTWIEFPDYVCRQPTVVPKMKAPVAYRRDSERPDSAKPMDAEAKQFFKDWETQKKINRELKVGREYKNRKLWFL